MSHKFRTPDQKNYKRATISAFTSTPTGKNVSTSTKFHSTSLSGIDTASSSSADRTKDISYQSLRARKATKRTKEALKNKKISKNKKKVRLNDKHETSSEWETESEKSIDEDFTDSKDSNSKKSDNARIKLFEDPYSPEKIRDAPVEYESPLAQSPILSRRFRSISKRINIVQREKLLPVNIPSSEVQNPEGTDEDEIILHRTNEVKTYSAHRSARSSENSLLDINWDFLYPTEYFTATSDLLWEKFVEENREKVSQYLAPSSAQEPAREYESEFLKKYPDIPPKFKDDPIPPGMKCTREYFDRISQKWVTYDESSESESKEDDVRQTKAKKGKTGKDKKGKKKGKDNKGKRKPKKRSLTSKFVRDETDDIYNPLNEIEDIEFETGGQDGKRMSFSKFRQKRKKMMDTVSDISSDTSSHSRTQ